MTIKKKAANKSTIKKANISNGQEKRKESRRKDDEMITKLQEIVLGMHKKIIHLEAKIDANNDIVSKAKDRLGL